MSNKFYRHVIQQNRNWIHESLEVSKYGNYVYPESLIDSEDKFEESKDRKVMMAALPAYVPTYDGPYSAPAKKE